MICFLAGGARFLELALNPSLTVGMNPTPPLRSHSFADRSIRRRHALATGGARPRAQRAAAAAASGPPRGRHAAHRRLLGAAPGRAALRGCRGAAPRRAGAARARCGRAPAVPGARAAARGCGEHGAQLRGAVQSGSEQRNAQRNAQRSAQRSAQRTTQRSAPQWSAQRSAQRLCCCGRGAAQQHLHHARANCPFSLGVASALRRGHVVVPNTSKGE